MISSLRGGLLFTLLLLPAVCGHLSAQPDLQADPVTFDFGTIPFGSERVDSLVILNRGDSTADISRVVFVRGVHFRADELIEIRLPQNAFVRPTITFHPTAVGCFSDTLMVWSDQQILLRIPVEGCATAPPDVGLVGRYTLEGGAAEVGEMISTPLSLLRDSAGKRIEYPVRLRFSVRYDPDALWPVDVRAEGLGGAALENLRSDRVIGRLSGELVMPENLPYSEEKELITIDWIGLSTGKPVNEIVADVSGTTLKGARVDTSVDALLLLEGCILDIPGLTQKIAPRRVSVDPVGMTLHVEMTMPRGSHVEFAVVDVDGRRRTVQERESNGREDEGVELIFNIADLPRGIHALQVSLGSDHLMIPFLRP